MCYKHHPSYHQLVILSTWNPMSDGWIEGHQLDREKGWWGYQHTKHDNKNDWNVSTNWYSLESIYNLGNALYIEGKKE